MYNYARDSRGSHIYGRWDLYFGSIVNYGICTYVNRLEIKAQSQLIEGKLSASQERARLHFSQTTGKKSVVEAGENTPRRERCKQSMQKTLAVVG